jgi:drug/metabolite transporter (DMT)-like permease
VLAFALVYLSWGTTYLAIKKGVQQEQLPPALFGGVRVGLAGVVLLGYLGLVGGSVRLPREDWAGVAVTGVLLFVGGNGLVTFAERTVPSGLAAVLVATTPLWIALVERCRPGGERVRARGWLGLALGLAGVVLLLAPGLGAEAGPSLDGVGPFLVLGSAFCWALGSVVLRHCRLRGPHLAAAAWQMVVGGGGLALAGLVCGEVGELPERVTPGAVGAFCYLLVVGSLVGFVAFNWLLSHVPAPQVGTYAYVNPIIAVLAGCLIDQEEFTAAMAGGIIVILAGVALVRGRGLAPSAPARGSDPDATDTSLDETPEAAGRDPIAAVEGEAP